MCEEKHSSAVFGDSELFCLPVCLYRGLPLYGHIDETILAQRIMTNFTLKQVEVVFRDSELFSGRDIQEASNP